MSDGVLMALGSFKFEIGLTAYNNLSQKISFRWSEQQTLGGRSKLHFTGTDNDTLDLDGTIYPEIAGRIGFDAYDTIKKMSELGKPYLLIDSSGVSLGRWVIVELDKKETYFTRDGIPRKIDFAMSLKAYS